MDNETYSWPIFATVAVFLFRFELILLFGMVFITSLVQAQNRFAIFFTTICVGISSAMLTLRILCWPIIIWSKIQIIVVSIPIDSFFWGRWLWPGSYIINNSSDGINSRRPTNLHADPWHFDFFLSNLFFFHPAYSWTLSIALSILQQKLCPSNYLNCWLIYYSFAEGSVIWFNIWLNRSGEYGVTTII